MFGLTLEKIFLITVLAGLLIGPQRLPVYTRRLTEIVRSLRDVLDDARQRAETDLGLRLTREEWEAVDVRRYDPRAIVRDALQHPPPTAPPATGPEHGATMPPAQDPDLLAQVERITPGQTYLVTGSAAHPRRILLSSLPADDPRRLAAEVEPDLRTAPGTPPTPS